MMRPAMGVEKNSISTRNTNTYICNTMGVCRMTFYPGAEEEDAWS